MLGFDRQLFDRFQRSRPAQESIEFDGSEVFVVLLTKQIAAFKDENEGHIHRVVLLILGTMCISNDKCTDCMCVQFLRVTIPLANLNYHHLSVKSILY